MNFVKLLMFISNISACPLLNFIHINTEKLHSINISYQHIDRVNHVKADIIKFINITVIRNTKTIVHYPTNNRIWTEQCETHAQYDSPCSTTSRRQVKKARTVALFVIIRIIIWLIIDKDVVENREWSMTIIDLQKHTDLSNIWWRLHQRQLIYNKR